MKTAQLIELLVKTAGPVEQHAVARRLCTAAGIGALAGCALLAWTFGINPQLASFLAQPDFWVKIGFPGALVVAGAYATARLGRPGLSLGVSKWLLAAPVLAIWTIAAADLANAEPTARMQMLLGETWRSCSLNIALLSVPAFVANQWALRDLAPTHLRLAGAASGLAAGALGALVYALYCGEFAPPFLAVWYLIGMLIPTLIGSALGPWVLRW